MDRYTRPTQMLFGAGNDRRVKYDANAIAGVLDPEKWIVRT